jgi:taurine dioxygenase
MHAAYEALSPQMKAYLEGLTAAHDGEHVYRGRYADKGVDDTGKVYPKAVHPVIARHPVSGRRLLFVNPTFTTRINEVLKEESDAVLRFLYEHGSRPDFQVRLRWRPNSVAFWDNRSVQHITMWDYFPQVRSGFRVTIKGERPHA